MLFLVEGFIRKANPLHIPESNGCGSFGYTVNEEILVCADSI
jgi:hypothetical protein